LCGDTAAGLCPAGWWYYAATHSCFYVSTASLVQTEARQECLDMDADLPSVSDQSEMDFLLSVSSVTIHTNPFNGPFSGITQVSRYQKDKTNLDFTEARDSEWQWHQLGHNYASLHLAPNR